MSDGVAILASINRVAPSIAVTSELTCVTHDRLVTRCIISSVSLNAMLWDWPLATAKSRRSVRVFALAFGIFANNGLHVLIAKVLLKSPFLDFGFILSHAGRAISQHEFYKEELEAGRVMSYDAWSPWFSCIVSIVASRVKPFDSYSS